MSGLTATGFERKRLVDIKADIETRLKLIFGENIDLSPQSGFGQFVGIESEAQSDQWESQENIYNSQYPSTAQGVQLSNVVMYNGIERFKASNSTVTGTISGINGTVIPAGSKASVVATGDIFVTLSEATISGGSVAVAMNSEEKGSIEATAGTLTVIETPIFGWVSITNNNDALVGSGEETDAELR
ncbi:MAG: baseplate J/gp47 family protein, partial [Nanoarchaeota archaeon]|nr:baseplate J/gp47 family protein [Nanoarchaeota archaeon]